MPKFPAWTWEIPPYFNIAVACTDAHADGLHGERPAVIVDDDSRGVSQLTFRELAEQTSRFAQLLRELGIAAGDRVLIRLPNCIEYSVVFLGAIKRGALPVPSSMLLTGDEIAYLARDSAATAVVTDHASWRGMHTALAAAGHLRQAVLVGDNATSDAVRHAGVGVTQLAGALHGISHLEPPHPTRAEDPAYLVYTSGTTSYPKGVLHAQRVLLGKQPSSRYWFDFRDHERVLHSGKYNWTYVLGTGLMDPLFHGHTTIVHEGSSDGPVWPALIAKHGATTFIGVPTLYRHILQRTACGAADVPSVHHYMCAGEPLSVEILRAWHERFGRYIYEGLGMTECSYYLCQTVSQPIRPGSAGFIQPGHDVKLLDPATWREVGPNEEGMLCIPRHDPALALGYWNQPEETARCFQGDWFLTGDYARKDEDDYIWFLGRRDDLIKSFGYRVSPLEVDRVFRDHPDVLDAATHGEKVDDDKLLVVTYVILRPGSTATADDLLHYGRQHLATYKAPRIVYVVNDLPRTRNGKILRRALSPELATTRSG